MITHLEPDILKCEVKWALESIATNKASGGDGIPVELFQILKDDAVKVMHSNMPANLEKSAVATGLEMSVFIPIRKKGNAKECSNYRTVQMLISFLFSFSPLLFASLLFTAICKASQESHCAFLHFFSMGMILIPVSCTTSRTSVHSSSGTLSDLGP